MKYLKYQAPFFLLPKNTLRKFQTIHPPTLFVYVTENATTFERKSLGNKNPSSLSRLIIKWTTILPKTSGPRADS